MLIPALKQPIIMVQLFPLKLGKSSKNSKNPEISIFLQISLHEQIITSRITNYFVYILYL